MLLANFNRKEHLRHRAVSLRQHGFLVYIYDFLQAVNSNFSSRTHRLATIYLVQTDDRQTLVPSAKNIHWKFHQKLWAALFKPQKLINRPRFCYESGWVQCPLCTKHYDVGSAYSDTAALTSCSRRSQYVKSWITKNWIQFSDSLCLVPAILRLQH